MDDLSVNILAKDVMQKNLQFLEFPRLRRNFQIVDTNSDISEVISLMEEKNADLILVKKNKKIVGIITKKEIIDIKPLLFEESE